MIENKPVTIQGQKYLIKGIDSIKALAMLPLMQRVEKGYLGGGDTRSLEEATKDLEDLLIHSKILRICDADGKSAPDVISNSQLPPNIMNLIELVSAIIGHTLYIDPSIPKTKEPKKT